jgi:hypothetical protein
MPADHDRRRSPRASHPAAGLREQVGRAPCMTALWHENTVMHAHLAQLGADQPMDLLPTGFAEQHRWPESKFNGRGRCRR